MMQYIKTRIYPNIGQISIWLGSVSLSAHIIMSFSSKLSFLHHFQVVYIQDYISTYFPFGWHSSLTRYPFSPVSCLFFIMLIVGGILYQKTDKKDSRLLKFGFFTTFLYKLTILLLLPFSYYQNTQSKLYTPAKFKVTSLTDFDFAITLIFSIMVLVISFLITKWLLGDQKLRFEENMKSDGSLVFTPVKASLNKRFVHFVFDKVMAFIFTTPIVTALFVLTIQMINPDMVRSMYSSKWALTIMVATSLFLYYLITEGFFGSTPIKCLTGTRVVDMYKFEKPDFGYVLGRSFSRFIPFDSLSYLGKGDWHDNISQTLVVEDENYGQNRRYHIWWIVAFISIYLIPYQYVTTQNRNRERERSIVYSKQSELKQRSNIFNLETGDILKGSREKSDYRSPYYLLKVIHHDQYSVNVERYLLDQQQNYKGKEYFISLDFKELTLMDTLSIMKDSLLLSYTGVKGSISVHNNIKLIVNEVYSINHPEIRSGGGSSYPNESGKTEKNMYFSYDLMPINVVDIENIEGDLDWDVSLPLVADFNTEQKSGSFNLTFTTQGRDNPYKSRLTLQYGDKLHKYILEGNRDNSVLYLEY